MLAISKTDHFSVELFEILEFNYLEKLIKANVLSIIGYTNAHSKICMKMIF